MKDEREKGKGSKDRKPERQLETETGKKQAAHRTGIAGGKLKDWMGLLEENLRLCPMATG